MKLLSIAIPCYNSEKYMRKCIDSLLVGGEDVEILIVDDGSTKDRTAEIADEYEAQFPTIVRAIHKENGGHGSAVNTGIANATGLYFKVVDSDDWVKQDAYFKILDTLRELAGGGQALDMLISNYVYEKEGESRKKVIQYRHILPVERMFTWKDCHHFIKGHYILMHSVIFRTKLLQECGLKLPEHTFYVDNLYVFEPLPYVKNMYYLDVNFYRYYIGRQDQSVNETVMISRIDQQIRVTKLMIDYLVAKKQELVKNRRLYQYMRNYLEIIMTVSSVLLIRSGTQEHLDKKKELWEYLKSKDKRLYLWMRNGIMGGTMNLPGIIGLHAALCALEKTGIDPIRTHELALTDQFLQGLRAIDGLRIVGREDVTNRAAVVSVVPEFADPAFVADALEREFGIMTRVGLHCAPNAHKVLGTFPTGTIRFSFGAHNTAQHVQTALDALDKLSHRTDWS